MPVFSNIPYRFGNQVKKEQKLVDQRITKEIKGVEGTKDAPVEDIESLRAIYQELSGSKAHHLWKEPRLKEEIAKLQG